MRAVEFVLDRAILGVGMGGVNQSSVVSGQSSVHSTMRDWLVAIGIAIVVTVLLQAPYMLGYLTAPREMSYTGLLVNVEDANYLTIIQRGSQGAWSHSLRFTSEPDAPAFLYVFYLALGNLARVLNLDATTMWHVARAGLTFITFVLTFGFVRTFIENSAARRTAYLLAILGSGFDWFAFPWESLAPTSATPIDLKMADAHLFHAALTFPHYLASISLLVILFWCAARLLNENLSREKVLTLLVLGALANIGVVLVYPFFILLSCGVLTLYVFLLTLRARKFSWRTIAIVAIWIASVFPLGLYYANALASSELLRVWSAQSQTLSPNPLHYVLTFAPYLLLAALSLRRDGLGDNKRALLWAWVFAVMFLVYAPLGAQRRFLQGVQIPLAILAACGLFEIALPRLRQARWFEMLAARPNYSAEGLQRLLVVTLVLLVALSSAYQWLSALALTTVVQPYPMFRPRAEIAAMDFLQTRANENDVVLTSYFTGSYLPFRSGTRVYLGHLYETIHFDAKQKRVDEFFNVKTDDVRRENFLRENGIGFVFFGRDEKTLGAFDPSRANFLQKEFETAEASVYRVLAR